MILDKLKLIDASSLELKFWMADKPQGEGSVDVTFGQLNFEAGGLLLSDDGKSAIVVFAEPKVVGKDRSTGENAFSLSIKLKMIYSYPSSETIDEQVIRDGSWYFSSFARTYFKLFAEPVLRQAGINGVSLPLN